MTKNWALLFQTILFGRDGHAIPINLGKKISSGTVIETGKDVYRQSGLFRNI